MAGCALFSNPSQAAQYSLNRPRYPPQLYEAILQRCQCRSLAVDIATGSGQAACALAEHFERVVALDGSAAQLEHADRRHANVHYQQADAHDTGLQQQCANLVTVAQALHWFAPFPAFYREVRRLLKPGGCFAAWTYGLPTLCTVGGGPHSQANQALWQLYDGVLGAYWAEGRRHVQDGYAGIQPVAGQDFQHVERLTFDAPRRATADDVVGLVSSWSAYHTFKQQHPDRPDPVDAFRQALLAALDAQDGSCELDVTHRITLLLATDPVPLE